MLRYSSVSYTSFCVWPFCSLGALVFVFFVLGSFLVFVVFSGSLGFLLAPLEAFWVGWRGALGAGASLLGPPWFLVGFAGMA